jgi:hypothetical protein
MRFFEFSGDDNLEKLVIVLKNFIGRASSKKTPAKLNWNGLQHIAKTSGIDVITDYETFKSMYDSTPALQSLVKNFNDKGLELNVPGAPEEPAEKKPAQGGETSQDAVDQMAASAAPQQLAAQA